MNKVNNNNNKAFLRKTMHEIFTHIVFRDQKTTKILMIS